VKEWAPERIAAVADARLVSARSASGPERVTIDSRDVGPGALFVGLQGANLDGGAFAAQALAAGAWGVLIRPEHAESASCVKPGVLLAADDPLGSLQRLAAAWRDELGATVVGITGSTGKTTTKDILLALLAPHKRTVASRENFNTEIGLPLEILAAPAGTEVLVLEHAMRGAGQITELAGISHPDVAVIVNVGPVHLELLGTIEAIAAAKAELIQGLEPGGTAVVPADEPLLEPHLRNDVEVLRFGPGGDVCFSHAGDVEVRGHKLSLDVPFEQEHVRTDLLAAVAAATAVGVTPRGAVTVAFSAGRGQRHELSEGITLIDDCYNANPVSMRAALEELVRTAGGRRTVAVLGDMLELGPGARHFHGQIGLQARELEVDVVVTVGHLAAGIGESFEGEAYPVADAGEAAALLPELLQAGDVVLVKGSRGVGLELVTEVLLASAEE
jgi:UDP-N-acetylmuramoyl-tripeptide--D-alanyl-D-alanine ligase